MSSRLNPSSSSLRLGREGDIRIICRRTDVRTRIRANEDRGGSHTSGQVISVLLSFNVESRSNPSSRLEALTVSNRFELTNRCRQTVSGALRFSAWPLFLRAMVTRIEAGRAAHLRDKLESLGKDRAIRSASSIVPISVLLRFKVSRPVLHATKQWRATVSLKASMKYDGGRKGYSPARFMPNASSSSLAPGRSRSHAFARPSYSRPISLSRLKS